VNAYARIPPDSEPSDMMGEPICKLIELAVTNTTIRKDQRRPFRKSSRLLFKE
jgi:hypothetical protein